MLFLFVGDIFGRPGREAVQHFVPRIRRERGVDFAVGNAENAARGRGLTDRLARDLFDAGLDVLTLGNHTWDQPETDKLLADSRILRPANYPSGLAGRGLGVYPVGGREVAVLQLMGRHHLANIDCPFQVADARLRDLRTPLVLVDVHAEASSEKQALGWYLNGRVSAVLGTHTHVQTADERVLPGGTAYIGDVGMAGPRDGIIGGNRDMALRRFLTGVNVRLDVAEGPARFCAVLVDVDEQTGRARGIERVAENLERNEAGSQRDF